MNLQNVYSIYYLYVCRSVVVSELPEQILGLQVDSLTLERKFLSVLLFLEWVLARSFILYGLVVYTHLECVIFWQ